MDAAHVESDIVQVLYTEAQIQERLAELAKKIEADYEGKDLLIVGILRGAVMVMADLARSFSRHVEMDWMAISSYGSGTKSSGVVRILEDLDTDISGRDVIIVDEIIDTGLTLSWLTSNLGGFIIGMLLGLFGGSLALSWSPDKGPKRSKKAAVAN